MNDMLHRKLLKAREITPVKCIKTVLSISLMWVTLCMMTNTA